MLILHPTIEKYRYFMMLFQFNLTATSSKMIVQKTVFWSIGIFMLKSSHHPVYTGFFYFVEIQIVPDKDNLSQCQWGQYWCHYWQASWFPIITSITMYIFDTKQIKSFSNSWHLVIELGLYGYARVCHHRVRLFIELN